MTGLRSTISGQAKVHAVQICTNGVLSNGQRQTTNHIVDTKFEGRLKLFRKAGDGAVTRLKPTETAALVK